MNVHILQHVEAEGPALIGDWAEVNQHELSYTKQFKGDKLPELSAFDMLVVMGGPMSFDDTDKFDWLQPEIDFIGEAAKVGKAIIGICLGSQLIALALGAKAHHGTQQEIGWFPVEFATAQLLAMGLDFPKTIPVMHWHGDTFDIPNDAIHFASSEAFPSQGFIWGNKVIGLQCHLEATEESIDKMLNEFGDQIVESQFVQSAEKIKSQYNYIEANNRLMIDILDFLEGQILG